MVIMICNGTFSWALMRFGISVTTMSRSPSHMLIRRPCGKKLLAVVRVVLAALQGRGGKQRELRTVRESLHDAQRPEVCRASIVIVEDDER